MAGRKLDGPEVDEPVLGDQLKKIAETLDKQREQSLSQDKSSGRASASRAPRQDREMETRSADEAPLSWRPADVLPDPPQKEGWVHRWVRGSTRGEIDTVNMAKAMREGWRPVVAGDYPEISLAMYNKGESVGTIEFGGLILCRMPKEMADARNRYYEEMSLRQIDSINTRLREEQDTENRVRYENESLHREQRFTGNRRR